MSLDVLSLRLVIKRFLDNETISHERYLFVYLLIFSYCFVLRVLSWAYVIRLMQSGQFFNVVSISSV